MSNGARHGLGVVIGLVVTPVTLLCLLYGTEQLRRSVGAAAARLQDYYGSEPWLGMAAFLVAAVLIGVVVGSRVSPLASLVPGAAFLLLGLVWIVAPRRAVVHLHLDLDALPNSLRLGHMTLGSMGVLFLLGAALVVASLAPSRWKGRTPAGVPATPGYAAPHAPMGPPPMPGGPAPMGAPQPPYAPGPDPSGWQGAPQYGPPPAQPAQPPTGDPPPLPPASSAPSAAAEPSAPAAKAEPDPSAGGGPDDDEPGEWTRVYGGDRPN